MYVKNYRQSCHQRTRSSMGPSAERYGWNRQGRDAGRGSMVEANKNFEVDFKAPESAVGEGDDCIRRGWPS